MHERDPIFAAPRPLSRAWGLETWLLHPANLTRDGVPLGERLKDAPDLMLGDLGRAPPRLRLVEAITDAELWPSDDALSYWRILEAAPHATLGAGRPGRVAARAPCAAGQSYVARGGAMIAPGAGLRLLEIAPSFRPTNDAPPKPRLSRLESPPGQTRVALLREAGLSIELWRLPGTSWLAPNGETCHALIALSPGVAIDGRQLAPGECAFIPACGRIAHISATPGAQAIAAYPDIIPTTVWRHTPPRDPAAAKHASDWRISQATNADAALRVRRRGALAA